MRALLLLVAAMSLAACTQLIDSGTEAPAAEASAFRDEADYRAQREQAVADLDALIGEAAAAQVSACRVVAVGAKACGGPMAYRVYSATASDASRVEAAAARVTALDRRANEQFQYVSDCMLVEPPQVALVDGRCVAR